MVVAIADNEEEDEDGACARAFSLERGNEGVLAKAKFERTSNARTSFSQGVSAPPAPLPPCS